MFIGSSLCQGSTDSGISCRPGLLDCCSLTGSTPLQCAPYENVLKSPSELKWVLILSFITMALMAFGIGANDAANNWGTSVGSGAVPLRWALLIGGLMDWLGASLLGHSTLSFFSFHSSPPMRIYEGNVPVSHASTASVFPEEMELARRDQFSLDSCSYLPLPSPSRDISGLLLFGTP
jgi:hypothetical protein